MASGNFTLISFLCFKNYNCFVVSVPAICLNLFISNTKMVVYIDISV
jgi:hypothetical protein